ncbi:hypothetical protein DL95DRAFT_456987 [Leptodontidium sp. 2 PMI_412]|nr:hypothetical protein DL95DRAFT_456987 [Leptodontidium sp. 2 PMI_412]
MAGRAVAALVVLCIAYMTVLAQTPTSTSFRSIFTVPSNADNSVPLLPNIYDSEAVNSQDACPSYMASDIVRTGHGFTAKLALAEPCLQLIYSWYVLPEALVPKPGVDADASVTAMDNDLSFSWSNEPIFGFTVIR